MGWRNLCSVAAELTCGLHCGRQTNAQGDVNVESFGRPAQLCRSTAHERGGADDGNSGVGPGGSK